MRRAVTIAVLVGVAVAGVGAGAEPAPAATTGGSRRIAPVVVRPLGDVAVLPVIGTDHATHALYELAIVNTRPTPITIDELEVRTLAPRRPVAAFEDDALASRFRRVDGTALTTPVLAPGEQVFMFVDVALFSSVDLPLFVDHRVTVANRRYNLARVDVADVPAIGLDAPVQGRNWVVLEGCCGPESWHRTSVYVTEAGYSTPGRFALELAQMDDEGRFVTGDPTRLESYPSYGQYVHAAATGRVVGVVDLFPDTPPGVPSEPGTFDEEGTVGNAVVLELGAGQYALYGGLRPGSVIVRPGSFVRKGQALAQIGNSGDGAQPRLHFELLSSPGRVGADGVPFVFNSFAYAGRLDPAQLAALGLAGPFADSRLPVTQVRSAQLPLDQSIVDLDAASGASGNPLL